MKDAQITRVMQLVESHARVHALWRSGWKPGVGNNARGMDPRKAKGYMRKLIVEELKRGEPVA